MILINRLLSKKTFCDIIKKSLLHDLRRYKQFIKIHKRKYKTIPILNPSSCRLGYII